MPNVAYNYTFDTDAQGLAVLSAGATTFAWYGGDGSPSAGCVIWNTGASGLTFDFTSVASPHGHDWTYFGVPPGAMVTMVQVTDLKARWQSKTGVASITNWTARFVTDDGTFTLVHGAGDLFTIPLSALTNSWVSQGAQTMRSVDSAYQPASTGIRFLFEAEVTTGSGPVSMAVYFDSIDITITYTTGSGTVHQIACNIGVTVTENETFAGSTFTAFAQVQAAATMLINLIVPTTNIQTALAVLATLNAFLSYALPIAAALAPEVFVSTTVGGGSDAQACVASVNVNQSTTVGLITGIACAIHVNAGLQWNTGHWFMAQAVFDTVEFYPGCGDVFGFLAGQPFGGKYGGPAVLRAGAILRGQGWGLVQTPDGKPVAATVNMTDDATGVNVGQGESDKTLGRYVTGEPHPSDSIYSFPFGNTVQHDRSSSVSVDGTPPVKYSRVYGARRRTRVVLRTNHTRLTPVFALRDYTHRLLVFGPDSVGGMSAWLYDSNDDNPEKSVIDDDQKCAYPSFYLNSVVIDGTYLGNGNPMQARSTTHGRSWVVTPIIDQSGVPIIYDAITSTLHKGRIVLLGYKSHDKQWFARVGVSTGGEMFTWSNEVSLQLPNNPNGIGYVYTRQEDGVIEFIWQDAAQDTTITRCRSIGNDGGSATDWS